jgi:regulatory protein
MDQPETLVITAIERQARNPDRVSIFADGEWVLGVHVEVLASTGLQVGQALELRELQAAARAEELRHVRESALRFLGYRSRSRRELQTRLERKGYAPELVQEVLEALQRSGLIDDAEFSRAWVAARQGSRPMGRNRLAVELRQKGVDRELVESALQDVDPDTELARAMLVGRQKAAQVRGEDPRSARRKLAAALMRRGYGWEISSQVIDVVLAPSEVDEE